MLSWAWWVLITLLLTNTAVLGLWWRTQQQVARTERRLARSEEARFQMRRTMQTLEARLATVDTELSMHRQLSEGDGDAAAPEPLPKWDDTQVSEGAEEGFVRTRPNGTGAQVAR